MSERELSQNKIIVIAGPTASGKTALSIELARRLGGEIVSADSMQVYRALDIGTAKASPAERALVPHHMLDVAEPWEDYSVARYVREASACCEDILKRGGIPIVTGGTGLYIDSLLAGREFEERSDSGLRAALEKDWELLGAPEMHERLRRIDPQRAEKLAAGDRRRIIRALEVYQLTGKTITQHDLETALRPPRFEAAYMVLNFAERKKLYERIDKRVDMMFSEGLVEEVRSLLAAGLSPSCTAMQAIGYKELCSYLAGEGSLEAAAEQIKQSSRRYAKRQLTWFHRREGALWINWEQEPDMAAAFLSSTKFLRSHGIS